MSEERGKKIFDLGLSFTPAKTKLVHFNNKKIKPGETKIKVNGICIKSSESIKFLGIHFDYDMSFKSHIKHIQRKSYKALNIIKFLCGTWWGSDPETLTTLYKSYIRSSIDYGCFIWFPKQKKLIEKIEKIQYAALRTVLGYRISTPTNIILAN